jgi:hypothetical protein
MDVRAMRAGGRRPDAPPARWWLPLVQRGGTRSGRSRVVARAATTLAYNCSLDYRSRAAFG